MGIHGLNGSSFGVLWGDSSFLVVLRPLRVFTIL